MRVFILAVTLFTSISQLYGQSGTIENISIPVECRVRLSIVDVVGREIALLVDDGQQPGTYELPFRTERLSSGLYFSRLIAGPADTKNTHHKVNP